MRFGLLFFFLLECCQGFGRVREFVMSDTAFVEIYKSAEDSDTYIFIRPDSLKNGICRVYFDSDHFHKAYEIHYTGKFTYYSSEWFENGQLHHTENKFSEKPGLWEGMSWFEDGKIRIDQKCYPDSCVYKSYFHNGQLKKENIDLPAENGYWQEAWTKEYYQNGQIRFTPLNLASREPQNIISYYPSGKIMQENTWNCGSVCGKWQEWYESGQIKVDGQFVEYDPSKKGQFIAPKKTGTWKYYSEKGKLEKEEFYEGGNLLKTVTQ